MASFSNPGGHLWGNCIPDSEKILNETMIDMEKILYTDEKTDLILR